ncbi:alpha/beta fold hydrolase [Altererythrobacter indicus]|uniref:Alpha/beta fold hydrolase n=2 Tax=Altericroceibacterium indicum TaxID=374177 RepID=A0A845ABU6_9SPHN|nr:alpha/beta fold hydrolase [Altericroceibacterium indicum]
MQCISLSSVRHFGLASLATLALGTASIAMAQVGTQVPPPVVNAAPVNVQKITVHSAAIEGNLEGESADRTVLVMLPPGYAKHPERRYPVVYALHGYSIGAEQWAGEIHVPQTIESAFAKGAHEMIVVMPDSKSVHNGSMYSSSVTTGDFEAFIAHDLIAYIDSHYRTIADRRSRGLVGHSMGGYGATRIGMKHADVFGALYLMSPCCLSVRARDSFDPSIEATLGKLKSPQESSGLPFILRGTLAMAAAWSPDPDNPPLYLDLPIKDGKIQEDVLAKWTANSPLAFVDQYIGNLRQYAAISMDVGDKDSLKSDTEKLHNILQSYHIANQFEIYEGDHTSRVAWRFQDNVLPFFSEHLVNEDASQ